MMRKVNKYIAIALSALTIATGTFGICELGRAYADAAEILPIAKYEFKEAGNLGKDSMGNYDMEYRNLYVQAGTGALLDGGTPIDGGGVTFDNDFCVSQDENSNMFADVSAFTLCFEIKTDTTKDWAHFIGVGGEKAADDQFYFVGRNSGMKGQLRMLAHGITDNNYSGYYTSNRLFSAPKIQGGSDENSAMAEFQQFIVTVQPGDKISVYRDGTLIQLKGFNASGGSAYDMTATINSDWTTASNKFFFSIGGSYNGSVDGSKTAKGSIRNVAVYDFAMSEAAVTAYHTTGKVTTDNLTGMTTITNATVTDDCFEGTPTNTPLLAGMTEEEMFAVLNPARAKLTLSDPSITDKTAKITWKEVLKDEETYYAVGTLDTRKLGYVNLFGGEVRYELQVSEISEYGNPVYEGGQVTSVALKDNMSEVEMLAAMCQATVAVTYEGGTIKTGSVEWKSVEYALGKYTAIGDIMLEGIAVGTVRVPLVVETTAGGPTYELLPIARYTFDSEETKMQDSMGNYPLKAVPNGTDTSIMCGTGEVEDGVLYLDGNSILANDQMNDIGDNVSNGFTLNFQYKQDGKLTHDTPSGGWYSPIGFGAESFGKSFGSSFMVIKNSDNMRIGAHSITVGDDGNYDLYYGPIVVPNAGSAWHNVTLTVRPGEKFSVFVDGQEAYSEDCPAGWNLVSETMAFAIGGRCIWGNGYNLFKGWIDNVSVYNFALTLDQSNAYWEKGKLLVEDMNGQIITSLADTPVFEGGTPVKEGQKLTDKLSDTQFSRRVNDATIAAQFENGSNVNIPITWTGVEQENGKWNLIGEVDTSNLGYATLLSGKTIIKTEVEVERVARTISFETMKNGTASADKQEAYLGDKVTITPIPDNGYKVDSVTVNGARLTADADGKYVYTVSGIDDVTVAVTFQVLTDGNGDDSGGNSGGSGGGIGLAIGLGVGGAVVLGGLGVAVWLIVKKRKH